MYNDIYSRSAVKKNRLKHYLARVRVAFAFAVVNAHNTSVGFESAMLFTSPAKERKNSIVHEVVANTIYRKFIFKFIYVHDNSCFSYCLVFVGFVDPVTIEECSRITAL